MGFVVGFFWGREGSGFELSLQVGSRGSRGCEKCTDPSGGSRRHAAPPGRHRDPRGALPVPGGAGGAAGCWHCSQPGSRLLLRT